MKQRLILFATVFFYFTLIFLLQKTIFMLFAGAESVGFGEFFAVLWHGFALDCSTSGYLSIIPGLFLVSSVWVNNRVVGRIFMVYYAVLLTIVGLTGIGDVFLYPYWGFHFDASIVLYLQSPKLAFASASGLHIFAGFFTATLFIAATYVGYTYIIGRQIRNLTPVSSKVLTAGVLFLCWGVLILPIRGGVTVSTMNISSVYFSDKMFLNHAAINPQFNLIWSFLSQDKYGEQYRFLSEERAEELFDQITAQPPSDSVDSLLRCDRPNVVLIIMESISANVLSEFGADPSIAPNLNRYSKEGVVFTNFYANSYRTDRGLVSILSGYPAHPTVAIMQYPTKTQSLPSIPKSLRESGYDLNFYYGGDANFANMRSYFVGACTVSDIVDGGSFPLAKRITKWGVPDAPLLERVYDDISKRTDGKPFMTTVLTLSSHEPFDVPTRKFAEPFLNSVAYSDSCMGAFVERLRASPLWDNTLIVFVADHAMQSFPVGPANNDPTRFHIPMIWVGGAVRGSAVVAEYGSQKDIAATLLNQLRISHSDFGFSTDLLNPHGSKFAFYAYNNGFSMVDSTSHVLYDNDQGRTLSLTGRPEIEEQAKAFFQTMYTDLGKR